MKQSDFQDLLAATFVRVEGLLVHKGREYAGSADRLSNFRRGAALTGVTALQTLFIYMSKHYDSVATYVRDTAETGASPPSLTEPITGRLDDIIAYCILAKAIIQEDYPNETGLPSGRPVPSETDDRGRGAGGERGPAEHPLRWGFGPGAEQDAPGGRA